MAKKLCCPSHYSLFSKTVKAETKTKGEWYRLRQIVCWLVGTCHRLTEAEQWATVYEQLSMSVCTDSAHNRMIHGFNLIALSIKTWGGKKGGGTPRKRTSSWRKSVLNALSVSYNWTLHYPLGSLPFCMHLCLVIFQFRRTEKNWIAKRCTDQWNQTHSENYVQQKGDPFERSSIESQPLFQPITVYQAHNDNQHHNCTL